MCVQSLVISVLACYSPDPVTDVGLVLTALFSIIREHHSAYLKAGKVPSQSLK